MGHPIVPPVKTNNICLSINKAVFSALPRTILASASMRTLLSFFDALSHVKANLISDHYVYPACPAMNESANHPLSRFSSS